MSSILHFTRRSCRGSLLNVFHSQSKVLGCVSKPVQKIDALIHSSSAKSLGVSPFGMLANQASHADHSHSQIWTAERFLSAGLIGIMPLALAFPNPALDYALALSLTVHVHWGIEAIVVDYIRPSVVGATLSRAAIAGVYALSVFTLGGLFYFNYSDIGLSHAIRMLWKL